MERLSSCYFCGDAVDASVAEYPLVRPGQFDVDTGHKVELCSNCRHKLTEVLERVLSAAFTGEQPPDMEAAMAENDDDSMTATSVEPVEKSAEMAGATRLGEDDDAELLDVGEDAAPPTDGNVDNGQAKSEAAPEASTADAPVSDSTDEESDETEREAAVTDDESEETADEDATATTEDDAETPDKDTTAVTEDGAETTDSKDESADEEPDGYRKAEFNKIVRLLQNRDFPVEIDELVVVAGSAYEIDEEACHAVIAALVDRGVVEDEGDTLVRP